MTSKQLEVLRLRLIGLTYQEIGHRLGTSAPAALFLHRRAMKNVAEMPKDIAIKRLQLVWYTPIR